MKWPQTIMVTLLITAILIEADKHGDPKTGKYNLWATLIAVAFHAWLLYWGGFFK